MITLDDTRIVPSFSTFSDHRDPEVMILKAPLSMGSDHGLSDGALAQPAILAVAPFGV